MFPCLAYTGTLPHILVLAQAYRYTYIVPVLIRSYFSGLAINRHISQSSDSAIFKHMYQGPFMSPSASDTISIMQLTSTDHGVLQFLESYGGGGLIFTLQDLAG